MKAYKGFDKDLKCGDFQYEVGGRYEEAGAELRNRSFHVWENPLDIFKYYPPAHGRYCEVELDEAADETSADDSKRVGRKIHVVREIGLSEIIEVGADFIFDHIDWDNSAVTYSGDWSAATNTGDWSAATNTGNQSAAANTGDWSAAANAGNWSAAANTGDESTAKVSGKESIAIVTGRNSKAAGSLGCWLVLTERDDDMHIRSVQAAFVDGEKIKPDTFYKIKNGKIIEAKD